MAIRQTALDASLVTGQGLEPVESFRKAIIDQRMIAVGRSAQGNQVADALRREVLQSRGLLPDDFSVILIES
jgi:hypothetical protein